MELIRKLSFSAKGMWSFRKSGYESAKAGWDKDALNVDLKGKIYLVTGANSGLGYVTALEIAKRGGKVHIICRNPERGKAALEKLISTSKNDQIFLHTCDLSLLGDIKEFVTKFTSEEKRLDVLINNAGALLDKNVKTKEGIYQNFALNTLGTLLLTESLVPWMIKNKEVTPRVITVSSGGMYTQKLTEDYDCDKMVPWNGPDGYAVTKRHQVILNEIWAKKFPECHFYSMHPGWASTEGVQNSLPGFYEKLGNTLRSPEEGADTIVWLAIAQNKKIESESGLFYFDREPTSTHLTLGGTQETTEQRHKFYKHVMKLIGMEQ